MRRAFSRNGGNCVGLLLVLWLLIIAGVDTAHAQSETEPRVLRAVRISGEIQLDGRLDEPEWDQVEPAKDFVQKLPDPGAPATEPTEVRILYNDEFLYVGAYCFDSAGPNGIVVNDITRRLLHTRQRRLPSGSRYV